jgi:hypothetical protein
MLIRYRTDMMDVPNADDGGIGLDADAQLWCTHSRDTIASSYLFYFRDYDV